MGREKPTRLSPASTASGSPPHGRGKAASFIGGTWERRITPAWAGKNPWRSVSYRCCGDHPRMGGEKGEYDTDSDNDTGSPPHGRGKGVVNGRAGLLVGITPAWAGKSLFCFTAAVPIQDHPRMGGEKLLTCERIDFRLGSPPRGRGKGFGGLHMSVFSRITPAWAGKSPLRPRHCAGG